jgi:hypothetical protein
MKPLIFEDTDNYAGVLEAAAPALGRAEGLE